MVSDSLEAKVNRVALEDFIASAGIDEPLLDFFCDPYTRTIAHSVRFLVTSVPVEKIVELPADLPEATYEVFETSPEGTILVMCPQGMKSGDRWNRVAVHAWLGRREWDESDTIESVLEEIAFSATAMLPGYQALCEAAF